MTLPADRLERLHDLEGGHFWSVGRDRLCDLLVDRYRMEDLFVDAGAGTGAYARRLRSRGRVVWLDVGPVEPGGIRAGLTALPFGDATVGTLLARDVLEHVDDRAALAEAHRVLRPGGHLLVTVPGWPSLWGPRDVEAGHLRRYRRRRLRRVVEEAGFAVKEIRGYQFLLLPVVVAARTLGRGAGDRLSRREEAVGGFPNRVLTAVNLAEVNLARRRYPAPPTGSSLVLVATRP